MVEKPSLYQVEGLKIITSIRKCVFVYVCVFGSGGGGGGGGGQDAAILNMAYLKVLLIIWFHKTSVNFFLSRHPGLKTM